MRKLEERTVLLSCILTGSKETEDLIVKLNNGKDKVGILYGKLDEILDGKSSDILLHDGSDYISIDGDEIFSIKRPKDNWSFIRDSLGWHLVLDY